MKKKTKKFTSVFLTLILIISIIPMSTLTASAAASGTCGENLTWSYDSVNCTLTISGTGAMDGYSSDNRPWESYEDNIKTVVINDGVTTIGNYAFCGCYSLTSVTISDSVTSIGNYAFASLDNLASVTIPNSVTTIGVSAFYFCTALTSIKIPDSVTTIGINAFAECASLMSVTIPDSVTKIDAYTFYYCYSLKNVTIPNSVTTIGGLAFYACTSLTSVEIPDSITSIGYEAFYGCNSLTSISIGNGIALINEEAFCYCDSLTDVYYNGAETQWNEITIGEYNDPLLNATIHFNHHMHSYESVATSPSCTEQGYTTYICDCGESYIDDYVDARGHTEETLPKVVPTCIEVGLTTGVKCSVCGEILTPQEEIPANGHNYALVITPPTCTEQGYTTFTCICGDSYIDDYVDATGHNANGDEFCDDCGITVDNGDSNDDCSCNCHMSGITKFFFNFMLFFQRLFGINKYCSCGVAHY